MRRVAIAGVLATDPEVLILDEPAASLDPAGHRALLDLLKNWHDEHGLTTVLVTHDMEDAARYADEIVVMDEGRRVIGGTPAEVFSQVDLLENIGLNVPPSVRIGRALQAAGWELNDMLLEPEAMASFIADQLSVREEG